MKCLWLLIACLTLALNASGQKTAPDKNEGNVEQKFSSGGRVAIHLEAGSYVVRGGDSEKIAISCQTDTPDQLKKVRVKIKIDGTNATVVVRGTPHNNFHATIDIPSRSDLWLRLSAGELRIEGIEGNKDIEAHAGDVQINVEHPEQYGHRDASVLAGSIDATAFGVSKDGLFRSFSQSGPGKYRLHAHLAAGDLVLRSGL
jgi:hypothetical protein